MEVELKRESYKICLFNTSHGRGKELEDTTDWAIELWESYDS